MNALEKLSLALDKQGFTPVTKSVVLHTVELSFFALFAGVIAYPARQSIGIFLGWFGLAGLCSAWNFWALAKFIHKHIFSGWSKKLLFQLVFFAQIRLFFVGLLLYGAFVFGNAPLPALLGGVSVSLICIMISGCYAKT